MSSQTVANNMPGPALPAMFARYKDLVEQELLAAVPIIPPAPLAPISAGMPVAPAPPETDADADADADIDLSVPLQYHLGWVERYGNPAATPSSQGKALRPTLCMFACEALEGDLSLAVSAAAAIELIHNFSLIHDDIQDHDLERRHQPTVWALWGQPKALVAGDAMQSLGDLAMLRGAHRGVPPETVVRVSQVLTEAYLEMIEGQCLDLGFESKSDITTEDYLYMIACKTGALIRSSLEIGAALAAGDPATTRAFASFGNYLGRAFQIRDDYLGVWGDESATGKSTDSDIRRKKKSFPAVFALERAAGSSRDDLLRIYAQDELEDADVERVMDIMAEVGALQYAERLTRESAEQATRALDNISLPAWARTEVGELVDFLANRQF